MLNNILNSDLLLFLLLATPIAILFKQKKYKRFQLATVNYILTFVIGKIIKIITPIPRPYTLNSQILGVTTNIPTDSSFPSLHTALTTNFAWILATLNPKISWIGFLINTIIAWSRVYLGLHRYQDLTGGFLLGTGIFWLIYLIAHFKKVFLPKNNVNTRRKLLHNIFGLTFICLIYFELINFQILFLLSLLATIFVLYTQKYRTKVLIYFERNKKVKLLGLGPLYFLFSITATTALFPKNIAIAGILCLTIGDSVNALIGSFQKTQSTKKKIPIQISAFLATILCLIGFVSPIQAILGSLTMIIIDQFPIRIKNKKIDDNLLIPVLSGIAMQLTSS